MLCDRSGLVSDHVPLPVPQENSASKSPAAVLVWHEATPAIGQSVLGGPEHLVSRV